MLLRAALLLGLLTGHSAFAQATKAIVDGLEKQWSTAIQKRDAATLEKLLSDDLVYAHASGVVDTKASYIAKIKEGKQVYAGVEQRNLTFHPYNDNAVVTHCWMRVHGVNPAGPFDDKVMMMHFWVKQGGAWKLAGHQTTKVDKLP